MFDTTNVMLQHSTSPGCASAQSQKHITDICTSETQILAAFTLGAFNVKQHANQHNMPTTTSLETQVLAAQAPTVAVLQFTDAKLRPWQFKKQ